MELQKCNFSILTCFPLKTKKHLEISNIFALLCSLCESGTIYNQSPIINIEILELMLVDLLGYQDILEY